MTSYKGWTQQNWCGPHELISNDWHPHSPHMWPEKSCINFFFGEKTDEHFGEESTAPKSAVCHQTSNVGESRQSKVSDQSAVAVAPLCNLDGNAFAKIVPCRVVFTVRRIKHDVRAERALPMGNTTSKAVKSHWEKDLAVNEDLLWCKRGYMTSFREQTGPGLKGYNLLLFATLKIYGMITRKNVKRLRQITSNWIGVSVALLWGGLWKVLGACVSSEKAFLFILLGS